MKTEQTCSTVGLTRRAFNSLLSRHKGHGNEPYNATEERVSLGMVFWQRRKKRFYNELICLAQKGGGAKLDDAFSFIHSAIYLGGNREPRAILTDRVESNASASPHSCPAQFIV